MCLCTDGGLCVLRVRGAGIVAADPCREGNPRTVYSTQKVHACNYRLAKPTQMQIGMNIAICGMCSRLCLQLYWLNAPLLAQKAKGKWWGSGA